MYQPNEPSHHSRNTLPGRRVKRAAAAVVVFMAVAVGLLWWSGNRDDESGIRPEIPSDPVLQAAGVRFYRPPASAGAQMPAKPPRAVIFFFGNDVGFWRPHRRLAADLARDGYAVAGFDIRPILAQLPDDDGLRDRAFTAQMLPIIRLAHAELGGSSADAGLASTRTDDAQTPLVLIGHSLGAELALWVAAHGAPLGIAGVVVLSPGLRSHLRISASDLLMTDEPTGPGSFSVPAEVDTAVSMLPDLRIAIVRASHDKLRYADSALLAAGGAQARRFLVPLAGHSLTSLVLARFVVRDAVAWVLGEHRPTSDAPVIRRATDSATSAIGRIADGCRAA